MSMRIEPRLGLWVLVLAISGVLSCQAHPAKSTDRSVAPVASPAAVVASVTPSSSAVTPPPAPATPVEQAIAEHRSAILAQRGVISVEPGVLPDGSAAMFVEMCADEAKKTLKLPLIQVPVAVFVDPLSARRASKPCGCIAGDAYYEVGEGFNDGCNGCGCRRGGQFTCTLLDCTIKILARVRFKANSAVPLSEDAPIHTEIVEVLRTHKGFLIEVQGYADKSERDPQGLSLRRARAVYDKLIAAGAPRERLRGPTALGSTKPVSEDKPELNRGVRFEVIMQP